VPSPVYNLISGVPAAAITLCIAVGVFLSILGRLSLRRFALGASTGLPVVADFRPMDLAIGGEAAPLAPLAHVLIFGHRKFGRAVLNIGGIANLTMIPSAARPDSDHVIAFDTGPGVMLIDALASKLSGGRMKMDRDGKMAARGKVDERLLGELMRHPYFRRRPPKSTGREEFGAHYLEQVEKRAHALELGGQDLIATLTALTARSIADSCARLAGGSGSIDQLIATGGGSRNPMLMKMLRDQLKGVEVLSAEQLGVNAEAIEAMAFAILAYRMLRGEPGNIPSVTGARSPAILGKLTLPPEASR
jgi:anhydro-N-acetylmuramic acid kinase